MPEATRGAEEAGSLPTFTLQVKSWDASWGHFRQSQKREVTRYVTSEGKTDQGAVPLAQGSEPFSCVQLGAACCSC